MLRKRGELQNSDVRSELDALRAVPPLGPTAWQAGRDAFLEQARALAPETPPDQIPSEPSLPRWEWRDIFHRLRVPFVAVFRVVLVLGLLASGAMGIVYASGESLPGTPLYPLKLQLEDWQYARLKDPAEQAEFAMGKAQERVDELSILASRGETIPDQVVTRYRAQLELALNATEALDGSQREEARMHIAAQLSLQAQTLAQVESLWGPGTAVFVRPMLTAIERTQGEIGVPPNGPQLPAPVATVTPTPSSIVTFTVTPSPTATPTPTPTAPFVSPDTETPTPTPTPTATTTSTATPTPTATPTSTATPTPTPTATTTSTATPTPTPTATPTPTPTVSADLPQIERDALIAFYNATSGAQWLNHDGWLQAADFCTWYGVVCEDGHVTALYLEGNGLRGAVPPEIGALTQLTVLELVGNDLTTLPSEIGALTALEWIGLRDNALVSLSPGFGNLTGITVLDLSSNALTSLPSEFGNLTALNYLNLSDNALTALPATIGNLTNLTNLLLNNNALISLPPELGNLSNLAWLELNNNALTSLPPQIGNLTNLAALFLNSNNLSTLPPQIGNLSSLLRFHLARNALTALPTEIGNLTALTQLELDDNPLSGELPSLLIPLQLGTFSFTGTDWCVPPTGAVHDWSLTIQLISGSGLVCDQAP
ncbi:MAG: leucine-rich repeat domain-containing protein [Anaerolineae bacterium]|nr:leucine-rich repeat domain-containing protein [Anaerolineae bacterium]